MAQVRTIGNLSLSLSPPKPAPSVNLSLSLSLDPPWSVSTTLSTIVLQQQCPCQSRSLQQSGGASVAPGLGSESLRQSCGATVAVVLCSPLTLSLSLAKPNLTLTLTQGEHKHENALGPTYREATYETQRVTERRTLTLTFKPTVTLPSTYLMLPYQVTPVSQNRKRKQPSKGEPCGEP